MGQYFVGSTDTTLHASGAETGNGSGALMYTPEENIEFQLSVSAFSGSAKTIKVITETGYVAASFTVSGTGSQTARVSMGGVPGGGHIQDNHVVPDGSVTYSLIAAELP